jgi:hypothetical protein
MVLYRTDFDKQYYFFNHLQVLSSRRAAGKKDLIEMNLHETPSRRLMLLAPSAARIPASFHRGRVDYSRYQNLLHEMQRLRGRVYLQDGAIKESSLTDGRHQSHLDASSWHLLVLNAQNRICGCARFHEHSRMPVLSELNAAHCALARNPEWSSALVSALQAELAFSISLDLPVVELGGWAVGEEIRGTAEALRIALGTYAFWQMSGNAVCISTATRRHCASSILRRIGGHALACGGIDLPTYYDPQYDCEMEVLKFYSWAPNPRYTPWVDQLKDELSQISIVARHSGSTKQAHRGEDWRSFTACAKTSQVSSRICTGSQN